MHWYSLPRTTVSLFLSVPFSLRYFSGLCPILFVCVNLAFHITCPANCIRTNIHIHNLGVYSAEFFIYPCSISKFSLQDYILPERTNKMHASTLCKRQYFSWNSFEKVSNWSFQWENWIMLQNAIVCFKWHKVYCAKFLIDPHVNYDLKSREMLKGYLPTLENKRGSECSSKRKIMQQEWLTILCDWNGFYCKLICV